MTSDGVVHGVGVGQWWSGAVEKGLTSGGVMQCSGFNQWWSGAVE